MTMPWVSSDTEIWGFDANDDILWYPDASTSLVWEFATAFDPCSVDEGSINSGELASIYTYDNNKFILNEMNYTPGMCYTFSHLQVPDPSDNYFLHFRGTYGGSDDHDVQFQVYNWDDSTGWTTFFTLDNSTFTQDYYENIPAGSKYFNGQTLTIRTIHPDAGNSGHLFRINYWKLHQGVAS